MYVCIYTYIHACMHAYIHTYINIYIFIEASLKRAFQLQYYNITEYIRRNIHKKSAKYNNIRLWK